ncbi:MULTISPECIES: hypothetical protein [Cupriavidus]|uniref:hypothetical protein n=1 Tax=Cupriavidus TaxID=106589 RepID=UPI0011ED706B|nr:MULTISPECIES: hypothetical protein [Cupriavidus]MWL91781.1 hypothetical protein [Cupriavidus sp. SW-Y-13]
MNVRTIIVSWRQSFRPYLLLTIAFNVLAIAFLLASVAIAARDILHSSTWYVRMWAAAETVGWVSGGLAVLSSAWLICKLVRRKGPSNGGVA